MTANLTYVPPQASSPARGWRLGPAALLTGLAGFTGLSNASQIVRSQTEQAAQSFLNVLSFPLPLEMEFKIHTAQWKHDTRFCSSPEISSAHHSYQRIIGMGPDAVPLILRDMRTEPGFWFDALMAITGEQPVSESHAGDIEAMCADWISWGRRNGLK